MKRLPSSRPVLLCMLATACTLVIAQGRPDIGKREYDNNCAVCHGIDAKGKGLYNAALKTDAPELSTLAKRNGGVFPVARLFETIEGAGPGHGTREMPIWGQIYRIRAAEYYIDVPYNQQAFVSGRILALIEYLNKQQVK